MIKLDAIVKNIVQPLATRMGTYGAGIAVGLGTSTQTADHVAIAIASVVTTVVLVVVDLFNARLIRKHNEAKAVAANG